MAHSWNADTFRCGCELCADVPEDERKGEPGQDPREWHLPVPTNRFHLALSRLFDFDRVTDFVCRHLGDDFGRSGWFRCGGFVKPGYEPVDGADPDDQDARLMPLYNDADERKPSHRGVILDLRGSYGSLDTYAGRVGNYFTVYPLGGHDDDEPSIDYFEVEIVASQRSTIVATTWDWRPYLGYPRCDTAIVSEEEVIRGAALYKREFYDWVRLNLVCLRALVDQHRAAPPGYLLIRGEFVKPRRTSRATTFVVHTSFGPPRRTKVDTGVISKLFDRATLPDVCFKAIVAFTGNLEPRRPWRGPNGVKWGSWDTLT